jgi:hypothetical protein
LIIPAELSPPWRLHSGTSFWETCRL